MTSLPDKMTGKDLQVQEEHELGFERTYFDGLDRADRRDKRGEITSFTSTRAYRNGFDKIAWSNTTSGEPK